MNDEEDVYPRHSSHLYKAHPPQPGDLAQLTLFVDEEETGGTEQLQGCGSRWPSIAGATLCAKISRTLLSVGTAGSRSPRQRVEKTFACEIFTL